MNNDNSQVIIKKEGIWKMYNIYFYKNSKNQSPVLDYIYELKGKKDKNSRIQFQKIADYIDALKEYGLDAGEPYIKHLKDKIWELRPQRNRILFVTWENDSFVLLHTFVKKTQKTPKEEIEKAQREILDIKKRGLHHE